MLSVGILGLPNVGKSTLFNAVTAAGANVSNYPFTTIDHNVGMVPVPDSRLQELERILQPKECTPCFIQFIDIAGLVKGASQGEGLGNQFLGHVRQVDAVVHLIRCFEDTDVAHVLGDVDPARDADVIETELLLADLDLLNRAIEKKERIWKTSPRESSKERERWLRYREALEAGIPLRTLSLDQEAHRELKSLGLLTGKPVLWVLNFSEDQLQEKKPACQEKLEQSEFWKRQTRSPHLVPISAQFESELQELDPEARGEFMQDLGLARTGLERLVKEAFGLLHLISFYTIVHEKLRAWEIPEGTLAPQAAGSVHTDMQEGFIRARVVSYRDLLEHGDFQALSRLGLVRTEGKEYVVQDGDVIEFLFSS